MTHAHWCCTQRGPEWHEPTVEIPEGAIYHGMCDGTCNCEGWDEPIASVLPFVARVEGDES